MSVLSYIHMAVVELIADYLVTVMFYILTDV